MLRLRTLLPLALAASSPLALAQSPYLSYEMNNSYAPAISGSGPNLTSHGGTMGASQYSFGVNQGLSIPTSALASISTYTIQIALTLSETAAYNRIIDYKDRSVDSGLYAYQNGLSFYTASGGGGNFLPNVPTEVTIVRDGATNEVRGYLAGSRVFTFVDTSGIATFTGTEANFFLDDFAVANESHPGSVDFIRFYNGALSDAQVAAITNPVPEPATMAALGLGVAALLRRRRKA